MSEPPVHQRCVLSRTRVMYARKSDLFMSSQALQVTPQLVGQSTPSHHNEHNICLFCGTSGKISATPLGQTSRSSCCGASQVSTSSACWFSLSTDSTHDPNRTDRSEVMVRGSPRGEDSVREGRNIKKKNSRLSRQPFPPMSFEKGNPHVMHGGFSLGLSLQQSHTICIGARRGQLQ